MSLAQENFDRACRSGRDTLRELAGVGDLGADRPLRAMHTDKLRGMAWDLEAVTAAIHMELNNRLAGPDPMDVA